MITTDYIQANYIELLSTHIFGQNLKGHLVHKMLSPFNHFIGGNGQIGEISKALLDIFNGEYGIFISVDPEHGSDDSFAVVNPSHFNFSLSSPLPS
jgi:hypothetical protein